MKTQDMKFNSFKSLMADIVRQDTLDGRDYLVIPYVLITEGVHNGVLYKAEELEKFTDAWNGRPVVIGHTKDPNDNPVTANQPEFVESQTVGQLFHTEWKGPKLHSEVWIDLEKAKDINGGPDVLNAIQNDGMVEGSTGLFTEDLSQSGKWHGEAYASVAVNHRPDHFALLPNGVGACSIADGAGGPRINKKEDDVEEPKKKKNVFKELLSKFGFKHNEISHNDIERSLRAELRTANNVGDDEFLFVGGVFDKFVIFEIEKQNGAKTFKQGYSLDANDAVALVGDKQEVQKVISFVPVTTNQGGNETGQSEEELAASRGGSDMSRAEQVDTLIADEKSVWGEGEKEFLLNLEDARFDEISGLVANQEEEKDESEGKEGEKKDESKDSKDSEEGKETETAVNEKEDEPEEKPQTTEDFIANAPEGMRETLSRAYQRDQSIKQEIIDELKTNKNNEFTEDRLKDMSLEELEKLAKLAKVEVDYSGRSTGPSENEDENDIPLAPKMNFGKKD